VVVEESWSAALESVGLVRAASGSLRRFFSRFRIRSKRDWSKVDISAAKPVTTPKTAPADRGDGAAGAPAVG